MWRRRGKTGSLNSQAKGLNFDEPLENGIMRTEEVNLSGKRTETD